MKFNFEKGMKKIGEDIKLGFEKIKKYQNEAPQRREDAITRLEKEAALVEREASARQKLADARAKLPQKKNDDFGVGDIPMFRKKDKGLF